MKKKRDKVAEYVKTLKQSRIDALYFWINAWNNVFFYIYIKTCRFIYL
jgi:hypothetical protein